ncbi:MAG: Asp-tRNA(Asn)/Glu-tRNA(Gln) amidotransferase GatCAB subunit A [Acidobacteriia bacterium]|nr:Asp-tRNA(Asn)/Glu-tRNA(Gln) amidotransferase GatCAB subunit A [Terriglobia bacterium]
MTLREAAAALRRREFSSAELTQGALDRIGRLNPTLNAFLTVTAEQAMARARQADAELAAGRDRGPLHGIPIAVKDLFLTRGVRTTAGSKIYENYVPEEDAAVVERLDAAGAVPLGKLNMHELAYGITSENPHFGAVRNPWDTGRSPGGSSGGSGAAVAASLAYAALGSDTGGSIRIPAAFCGTAGLKPTYGRVSRYGALPLSWTLDHMGPMARTVRDAAAVLNAIAGFDPRDPSSSRRPAVDYVPEDGCSSRGVRVGLAGKFYFERLDPGVEAAVRGAIARAAALGAVVKAVQTPDIDAINAVGRVIQLCEVSALMQPHLGRSDDFGADVWSLLNQGTLLPATDYINAQRLRRRMRRDFQKLWAEVDCLIAPTTPNTAPEFGQTAVRLGGRDENVRLASTRLVRAINVLGLPALSMPCGLSGGGLPVGIQIVGAPFQEALILQVGAALEDAGVGIPPCPI